MVAIRVPLSLVIAVVAVGVPVSAGEARRAYDDAAIHQSCAALVAVAAVPEIFIPAVPGPILTGLRFVRPVPFPTKLVAKTVPA